MKKTNSITSFELQWEGISAHLKSYLNDEEQEDLHQFRVKIKKLKAFLILSDSATRHPTLLKQFKPIKKIFKQAGKLRDAYLNLGFMKLVQPDNTTVEETLIHNAAAVFKLNGDKYLQNIEKVHRLLKKEIRALKDASIDHFYRSQLRYIELMLNKHHFEGKLHDCRKRMKILLYNYKLVYQSLSLKLNKDYLDQLQHAIGEWHDQTLFFSRLSEDVVLETMLSETIKQRVSKLKKDIIGLKMGFYYRAISVG